MQLDIKMSPCWGVLHIGAWQTGEICTGGLKLSSYQKCNWTMKWAHLWVHYVSLAWQTDVACTGGLKVSTESYIKMQLDVEMSPPKGVLCIISLTDRCCVHRWATSKHWKLYKNATGRWNELTLGCTMYTGMTDRGNMHRWAKNQAIEMLHLHVCWNATCNMTFKLDMIMFWSVIDSYFLQVFAAFLHKMSLHINADNLIYFSPLLYGTHLS